MNRVFLWIPLIAWLHGCASTEMTKKTTETVPNPDDEITAANWRSLPKPEDPYTGTPYEGTAANPIASQQVTAGNDPQDLPSDQEPTYNPNAPVYPDLDHSATFTPTPNTGRYHIVEPGDTLWKIAREYNTNVSTLRSINGFNNAVTIIRPGDKIKLP